MARPSEKGYGNGIPLTRIRAVPIDKRLLDILCCPVSKVPVLPLGRVQLDALNREIATGAVRIVSGEPVTAALTEALVTRDGKVVYRVDDGIPVMLPDQGIGTTQLTDFPR